MRCSNGVLGGWSVNGVGRVQNELIDFGSVRLVGMTAEDLQQEYHVLRINPTRPTPDASW